VSRRPADEGPSWIRRRGWPRAGQIGLAIAIGLIVATFIGALTRHDGSKSSEAPVPTTAASERVPTSRRPPTKVATTAAPTIRASTVPPPTAPPTTAPPTTRTTVRPVGSGLVPLAIEPSSHANSYSRDTDFGGWLDVTGCQDTRATLLMRTSQTPVTFTSPKKCTVKTGKWTDPWSGAVTTIAHDFQIDHTVPLANAWRSGAWSWTHDQRVAYANDLADKDHLVPILAAENESKSDSGPDEWKPPSPAAWCRYALDWDRIKAKWHLTATPTEWTALQQMAAMC
jgi:hypothetical protein